MKLLPFILVAVVLAAVVAAVVVDHPQPIWMIDIKNPPPTRADATGCSEGMIFHQGYCYKIVEP